MISKSTKVKSRRHHASEVVVGAIVLSLLIIGVSLYFLLRSVHMPQSDPRIKVVAGQNFWGSLVSQIGGERVAVESLASDPTTDPHLYESDAKDGLAVAQADIVIVNGGGYDVFLDRLIDASPSAERSVIRVTTVMGLNDDINPHIWYDVGRVDKVVDVIVAQLSAKDPTHTLTYQANARVFKDSLQPLLARITQIRDTYSGTSVAYTEPVANYLIAAAGLVDVTPPGFARAIEEGVEPNLADQTAMQNLIPTHRIKVLFYNPQAASPVTERIRNQAVAAGIPVVEMTETMPPADMAYQTWQLKQLDALLAALENKNE